MNLTTETSGGHIEATASTGTSPPPMTAQRYVCDELRGIIWRCQREQRLIRRALAPPCDHIDYWTTYGSHTGAMYCWDCGASA